MQIKLGCCLKMHECVQTSLAKDSANESWQNETPNKICHQHMQRVHEYTCKTLRLHNERELGAIKDENWIEGNVTMISQNIAR